MTTGLSTFLRILVIAVTGWLIFSILFFGRRARGNNPLGELPVAMPVLLLAKIGLFVPLVLLFLKAVSGPPRLSAVSSGATIVLLIGGSIVFTLGFVRLGPNLRVGLPREETGLVTSGIYGFSRNPIYVGIYGIVAASLVYAFSWLNLAAALVGVALHHRIVLAEERFLAEKFQHYQNYCSNVRRYI